MFSARPLTTGRSNVSPSRYSFFWARNAIYHSLKLLNIQKAARVLVPAYICRAAVDPFIAYGLDVDFYSVKRDCRADLLDLEARITRETKAVLFVHYFGFPQQIRHVREVCDRYQLALIEDCAHVLCGEVDGRSIGTFGDAAVFSWRKFLPVFDGAELVMNRQIDQMVNIELAEESALFTLKVALNLVERSMSQTRRPIPKAAYSGLRVLESAIRKCVSGYLKKSPNLRVESTGTGFYEENVYLPMSRLSRWIKAHSDIRSIVSKRRRNYEVLQNELQSSSVIPLFPMLPPSVCPWVLPVFFNGIPNAHRLLRKRGIPAAAWDDVRHPRIHPDSFIDSDFLYENLVFLPIHQCLDDQDVLRMATVIRSL
jgi:dTDP-4-amino-4,6-dideoxygalactose transaminase